MAEKKLIISPDGLQFVIELLPESKRHKHKLAWGKLNLAVAGQTVWGNPYAQRGTSPVEWTLVDLLHGLARIWPWLMYEEGYPIPINPEHPGEMMDVAQKRWKSDSSAKAVEEDELLYDFRQRHDLSLLMRGIWLQPLWLLKEGRDCLICFGPEYKVVRSPHEDVMQSLQRVGDFLCNALTTSCEERAQRAVQRWQARHQVPAKHYLSIVTGLHTDELQRLSDTLGNGDSGLANFFELSANDTSYLPEPNELQMAARMTRGYLSLNAQTLLLEEIRAVQTVTSEKLDQVCAQILDLDPRLPAHDQAYALAGQLRELLALAPDAPVNPDQILKNWGIPVKNIAIEARIDAAAVWGKHHGPAVLLNRGTGSRASTSHGRRSTLAHEICHLLVDRQRALPVGEVLGGQVALRAEKRANAFAAELLLPRAAAASVCSAAPDLIEAANSLVETYGVSREIVFNQICNSSFAAVLDPAQRHKLESWKLRPPSCSNSSN